MPLDHYVTLGRSGLRVSPFCLGAMTFGEDFGWGSSVEDSEAIFDAFIDRGGNFVDTANAYTMGHSETVIGNYIRQRSVRRDQLVIGTKFFCTLFQGDPNAGGASRKSLTAACNESLRRLQTDYIDLYWLHQWDRMTPIEETMRALDDLVSSGKVRYIGFSNVPAWKVAQAQVTAEFRDWAPLIALQIEYSLMERTVEGELMPMAGELGLGVTPWSPLKSGLLTGKYTRENMKGEQSEPGRGEAVTGLLNDRAFAILDELNRVSQDVGATPAAVALAWLQSKPGVTSTIIGARTMNQLEQNLAGLDVSLTSAQASALDEVSAPTLNFPAPYRYLSNTYMHGGATVNGEASEMWHGESPDIDIEPR